MFGGAGLDANSTQGFLNDLWEFDPSNGEWTWRGGSANIPAVNSCQPGIYGTRGTAAPSNVPGGRTGAASWVDATGNFWLFGGAGCDASGASVNMNDLWKFEPSSGNWTWISGNDIQGTAGTTAGSYGSLGSPSASNRPGSRDFSVAWTDPAGKLWLFGGYGSNSVVGADLLNDLWSFDPGSGEWTWVAGSDTDPGTGPEPVYGEKGKTAPGNTPGARDSATGWVDASGNLWLFGGFGNANSYQGYLNDFWKFDTASGQWAWVSGSNAPAGTPHGDPGSYGTLGIPDPSNAPSARVSASPAVDSSGHLLLFAGEGVTSSGSIALLNDAWMFDISNGQWSWIGGTNVVPAGSNGPKGIYGSIGVADPANLPGGRMSAASWSSPDGSIWVFGGEGVDGSGTEAELNDLWFYDSPTSAPAFDLPGGSYTSKQKISISNSTSGAVIYFTTDGSVPSSKSGVYTSSIFVSESETIKAIAIAKGHPASAVASATYTITLQTPTIALSSSAATAFASNPVTFTATLTGASGTPTGSVTFLDGTTTLGTGTISNGVATYTTSSLSSGTHTVTASYDGDDNFTVATSAAATETIVDFSVGTPSSGSTSATVQPGGTATYTLSVTPPSGSKTPVDITFSVSGLPAGATGTFNPTTVPAGSGATNVTLSVAVPAQSGAAVRPGSERFPVAWGLLVLPLLGLRRNRRAITRTLLLLMLAVTGAISIAGMSGCGGSGSNSGTTHQPQTYTLKVTATAGALSHTTNLTLTVE